jgi:hypothetical protein
MGGGGWRILSRAPFVCKKSPRKATARRIVVSSVVDDNDNDHCSDGRFFLSHRSDQTNIIIIFFAKFGDCGGYFLVFLPFDWMTKGKATFTDD